MQVCEAPDCVVKFEPQRSTARFHSTTCRQRAARARKAAAAEVEAKRSEGSGDTENPAEHSLVRAVRKELETAEVLDTVAGQLALQFARRIVNPDEAALSPLSKELRALMAEAKATAAPAASAESQPSGDEVTRARRARERKAGQAAPR